MCPRKRCLGPSVTAMIAATALLMGAEKLTAGEALKHTKSVDTTFSSAWPKMPFIGLSASVLDGNAEPGSSPSVSVAIVPLKPLGNAHRRGPSGIARANHARCSQKKPSKKLSLEQEQFVSTRHESFVHETSVGTRRSRVSSNKLLLLFLTQRDNLQDLR